MIIIKSMNNIIEKDGNKYILLRFQEYERLIMLDKANEKRKEKARKYSSEKYEKVKAEKLLNKMKEMPEAMTSHELRYILSNYVN